MRVSGIGKKYAELREGSGVETLEELRRREATPLTAALKTLSEERRFAKNFPAEELVQKWIAQARNLVPAITR